MAKKRARSERRESERAARKEVAARQALAALEPGGSPERPIVVPAAPVVPVRARSLPCPLCGGEQALLEETAERHQGRSLRAAHMRCQRCGAKRVLWFALGSPLPS